MSILQNARDTQGAVAPSPDPSLPPAPLPQVCGLRVAYGDTEVVHDVSFSVAEGSALAPIGESGSGKSTIARAVLRLHASRRARVDGSITLQGRELTTLRDGAFLALRGRVLGFVPQDPGSSLNPVRSIGAQAHEAAALVPGARRRADREALVRTAFERVGIEDPQRILRSFPHQLSGGQLQRVLIALAILPGPRLLVADEPTAALDVTVQKQILDLLDDLRRELGTGVLLITHDLAIATARAAHGRGRRLRGARPRGRRGRRDGDAAAPARPLGGQAPVHRRGPSAAGSRERTARAARGRCSRARCRRTVPADRQPAARSDCAVRAPGLAAHPRVRAYDPADGISVCFRRSLAPR